MSCIMRGCFMVIIHRDTDYAIRAMARLAGCEDVASTASLAESINVPVDFLRKIMQKVNRAGLVESVRGPFGGYILMREPEDITLHEIVEDVQGPLRMNACFADPELCENSGECALQDMLGDVEEKLSSYLDGVTLQDIIRRFEEDNS